eukprot:5129088-Heterocapsa_arctica.AAC.1
MGLRQMDRGKPQGGDGAEHRGDGTPRLSARADEENGHRWHQPGARGGHAQGGARGGVEQRGEVLH